MMPRVRFGCDSGSFGVQSPSDRLAYVFDADNELLPGEDLARLVSLSAVPPGLIVMAASMTAAEVMFWASGGTSGQVYQILCAVLTSDGLSLEGSGRLYVGPAGLDDTAPQA